MRFGHYTLEYGKPSQGCKLRGSSPLSSGLVSCVPFSDVHRAVTSTTNQSIQFGAALDIAGYNYQVQWSGKQPGFTGIDRGMSPWGDAARFHDQEIWISYLPNQTYLSRFPSGAAPRTLSALINLPPYIPLGVFQMIANYGPSPAFGGFNGSRFALAYHGEVNPPFVGLHCDSAVNLAIFVPDGNWHMVSVVFPVGGATVGDALIYIDGMLQSATVLISNGGVAVNTVLSSVNPGKCYSIGQENAALEQGTPLYGVKGLVAGVWLWNRALSPTEQALHWADPFHMIARPRSLPPSPAIVLAPPPPPPTPPTCNLVADFTSILLGQAVTLSWTTTNTPTSASIDNGVGSVSPISGSAVVHPTATTTYHLTVSNIDGSSQCQVTITVINPSSCNCPDDVPYFGILQ